MVDRMQIREHMEVVGSDGAAIGKVDSLDGEQIKVSRAGSPDGHHHYVPLGWVSRVDDKVHLDRDAAAAGLAPAATAAASTAHTHAHTTTAAAGRRNSMVPWLVGGAAVLALLLGLSQCDKRDTGAAVDPAESGEAVIVPPRVAGAPLNEGSLAYDLDRFLAGKDGTPRTFTFDRLNFDPGSATIRRADENDLDDIARVFAGYPDARAAVVGYTDANGAAATNRELGAQRSRAVIDALAARGVAPKRFEARSGGEDKPAASNAGASGRFENRRTELVILHR